jgi:hypothetical protein
MVLDVFIIFKEEINASARGTPQAHIGLDSIFDLHKSLLYTAMHII